MTISNTTDLPAPQCHLNNTMANLEIRVQTNTSLLLAKRFNLWKFIFNKPKDTVPDREIPVLSLSKNNY